MINSVVLVGRLVRDPELKRTGTGVAVVSITIAIDNRMKGPNGKKTTSFIPCKVWGAVGENTAKFTRKGSLVGVTGRINQSSYDNKEGRKVQVIEVVCDSVQFLETRNTTQTQSQATDNLFDDMTDKGVSNDNNSNQNLSTIDTNDDDLPF